MTKTNAELDAEVIAIDRKYERTARIRNGTTLEFTCLADVEPRAIEWLWPGRIARGKLTLLTGDPGVGKSQISLDIAATITEGREWPDGGGVSRGSVIL